MQSAAWHRWALQPYPTRATRVNGIMQLHYCKSVQSLQITALQIHFENTAEDQECFYSCSAVMKFYLKPAGPPYLGCISAFPSVGTNRSVQVLSAAQVTHFLQGQPLRGRWGERCVYYWTSFLPWDFNSWDQIEIERSSSSAGKRCCKWTRLGCSRISESLYYHAAQLLLSYR